jgi:hypothetical protein
MAAMAVVLVEAHGLPGFPSQPPHPLIKLRSGHRARPFHYDAPIIVQICTARKYPSYPQTPQPLWTARYCVTTSQCTRQLADHNPACQPTPCWGSPLAGLRAVDFVDKPISRLVTNNAAVYFATSHETIALPRLVANKKAPQSKHGAGQH